MCVCVCVCVSVCLLPSTEGRTRAGVDREESVEEHIWYQVGGRNRRVDQTVQLGASLPNFEGDLISEVETYRQVANMARREMYT